MRWCRTASPPVKTCTTWTSGAVGARRRRHPHPGPLRSVRSRPRPGRRRARLPGCSARVVTLDPSSLDDVIESIGWSAMCSGWREEALHLVGSLRRRLETSTSALHGVRRRDVLVLEWTDPPFSAGHWVPDLVVAGGGVPLLANAGRDSMRIEWSALRNATAPTWSWSPRAASTSSMPWARAGTRRIGSAGGRRRGVGGRRGQLLRPTRPAPGRGRGDPGRILHPTALGPVGADRARRVTD